MVFVLAVLVVAVPAPFVAEVALEPGDETKRVVLRRIAGRKQIRRVIAAEHATCRGRRPDSRGQEGVVGRDQSRQWAERAVGRIADRIAAGAVHFGEELERIAQLVTHVAQQRLALDVRAHVREAVRGKAAVTAEAREEPRIQARVERCQIAAVGSELLLHAAIRREQSRLGGRELGIRRDDEVWLAVSRRRETGIRVGGPGFRAPVAERRAGPDRILLLQLGTDQEVPAVAVAEGHAEAERRVHVVAVAFGRLAVVELRLETLEVLCSRMTLTTPAIASEP